MDANFLYYKVTHLSISPILGLGSRVGFPEVKMSGGSEHAIAHVIGLISGLRKIIESEWRRTLLNALIML